MSLQDLKKQFDQLSGQDQLSLATISRQAPALGGIVEELPVPGSVLVDGAVVSVSGSGADERLEIAATMSWELLQDTPFTCAITNDASMPGNYLVVARIKMPASSQLGIPNLPWFSLSDFSAGGQSFPYSSYSSGLGPMAEVSLNASLVIKSSAGETPIPIKISTDSDSVLLLSLDGSAVDLPSIDEVLAAFGAGGGGISLPPGLDKLLNFSLEELSVGFDPEAGTVSRIGVGIANSAQSSQPWTIIPGFLSLDSYTIALSILDPLSTPRIGGYISATLDLGTVAIEVGAQHPASGGWILSGGIAHDDPTALPPQIDLRDLATGLASTFKINLPAFPEVILTILSMSFDTASGNVTFDTAGNLSVADTPVGFKLHVDLSHSGGQYEKSLHGTLTIGDEAFELDFDKGDATILAGTWTAPTAGQTLDLADIMSALGLDAGFLPGDVKLTLNGATIVYDSSGWLVLAGDSQAYGDLVFVWDKAGSGWGFAALDTDTTIDLSNLPLVGAELEKIAALSIDKLQLSAAAKGLAGQAARFNAQLASYQKFAPAITFPTFPTPSGSNARVIFAGALEYESGSLPFELPLIGAASPPPPPAPAPATAPAPQPPPPAAPAAGNAPATMTTPDDGTLWYNLQKTFGPVSIQRVGIRYAKAEQKLWFELDASLTCGPLSISLLGLGIGSKLSSFSPDFSLQGLGIAYRQPPLTIGGSLVNLVKPGDPGLAFAGSLIIETSSFSAEAFGYYGKPDGAGAFPSLFIFLESTLAVGGPPEFTVTGIAGGFGYNSSLALPDVTGLDSFPFLALLPNAPAPNPNALGGATTPLAAITSLTGGASPVVTPDRGQIWVAAGLTFTSFELIKGAAMLIVEAGDELQIALLGSANAQFPQKKGPDDTSAPYAQVVLDVEARFQPQRGTFSIEAVLSKGSFLLDPACVLTGGFAFYIWYGPSDYAGDFVLTLGGYHSAFQAPTWYPQVPRVGFQWPIDDHTNVQGGVYLAITPSVMMAGGALDVTFQSGNLKAWLTAHCDVIVRWKPFFVVADIGISVGASYKLDLLFTSTTLSVELGCDLTLWGPPTGGTVTVDWYVISFTIGFGTGDGMPPVAPTWTDVDLVLPLSGAGAAKSALSMQVTGGLVSERPAGSPSGVLTDDPPPPIVVRAGAFAFTTRSPIPASSAVAGPETTFAGPSFCVHPLGWSKIDAVHTVTFEDKDKINLSDRFEIGPVLGAVPSSLWGSPPDTVPSAADATVPAQITGLSFRVNAPAVGATAGPIDAATDLAQDDLKHANTILPLPAGATGAVPVNSGSSIKAITDAATGIGAAAGARGAIFESLSAALNSPPANDDMKDFAKAVGCRLAAEPLIVS